MKTKLYFTALALSLLACSCQIKKPSNEKTVSEQTLRLGVNNWFFWRSNANGEYVAIGDLQEMTSDGTMKKIIDSNEKNY